MLLIATSCKTKRTDNDGTDESDAKIISKPELKLESDIMTPEVLWSFGRLSDLLGSKKVIFLEDNEMVIVNDKI